MTDFLDIKQLKQWFNWVKRDLPWRHQPSPYAIWVSEVMLQQTQVAVVIPYFERWMKRFPTIKHLVDADLDEVLKMWEGLGYYSRARNLFFGARYVLEEFEGELPSDPQKLKKIKGLGPYTIGAICSFAFHQRIAAVDGNVVRVLTRYFQIKDDISKPSTINKLRQIANEILPEEESWIINEALIELGATLCKNHTPKCGVCPLRKNCQSYLNGTVDQIPYKSQKIKTEVLYRVVPVLSVEDYFLVRKCKKDEIMSDLHEFPYFETTKEGIIQEELMKKIEKEWNLRVAYEGSLEEIIHSFTRFRVYLKPFVLKASSLNPVDGYMWRSMKTLSKLAFSSGHRRILETLKRDFTHLFVSYLY